MIGRHAPFGAAVIASILIAACGGPEAPGDSAPPTSASPTSAAPSGPPAAATATAVAGTVAPPSAAVAPSPSGSGFAAELITSDRLVICTSFNRTRFAERDANGEPFGVDVEIGQVIADALGREAEIVDVPFDELIDAVVARQCDVTIAGQFITQDRLAQIGMVPYREGAPNVIVPAGNPLGIDAAVDLCARSFAVVAATVYVDMVIGAGDYVGEGINDACLDAGVAPVDLRQFPDQQQAEAALSAGDVDAYAGNEALAVERPGEFELTFELPRARNGIGHRLDAALLDAALRDALRAVIADGRYLAILERYGAEGAALTITL
jgi:polar amino acid transport system substrate-binding protein